MTSIPDLRKIISSFRTEEEELNLSRLAILNFITFGISCFAINLIFKNKYLS